MLKSPFHTKISLQERLSQLTGHLVEINAARLGLEPGRLQKVYKRNFIQVQQELFVATSLNSIRVFDISEPRRSLLIGIRTTFPSGNAFNQMKLVQIGLNFIEVQAKGKKYPSRILFPLNKIEGIFRITPA
ncbi:hypothetical protein J2T13_001543 [Paenibacillus sp. DS2015]|uniref:hypothetical protein n=1 Tax=Paenibacillus sp. DS2015 TaxID=3373917 RepID=UPI003D1EB67D